jgi:AcrR family transcriptional regulator
MRRTRKPIAPRSPVASRKAAPVANNRLARRERRREASRDEILSAARRVLLRQGIASTTLAAVAEEAGLSKASLYYYYPSKDALLFELIFGVMENHAAAIKALAAEAANGSAALNAILRGTFSSFANRLDDFRLAFLHGQVAGKDAVHFDPAQFARIRPLNELIFGDSARKLADDLRKRSSRARVEPRLMAFLAYTSALGLLTMKGMVESVEDPLLYPDEQLIEGLARIFAAAAAP